MKELQIRLFLAAFACIISMSVFGQKLGEKNMLMMNNYIINNAASNMQPIKYAATYGIAEQASFNMIERFKMHEIKLIQVEEHDGIFTVQFLCDPKDPCINQMKTGEMGQYISGTNFFFTSATAANNFASLAAEIIKVDFKKEVQLIVLKNVASGNNANNDEEVIPIKVPIGKEVKEKELAVLDIEEDEMDEEPTINPRKKVETQKDILSLKNYNDEEEEGKPARKSNFETNIIGIIKSYNVDRLEKIKGQAMDNAFASLVKLPKAKKNYINQFKGENCFVAEFGSAKLSEELEDSFNAIIEELDNSLSTDWESVNHSQDEIYADSELEIYHIEYIHTTNNNMPSITIMIAPDGKRATLFMRIGKY